MTTKDLKIAIVKLSALGDIIHCAIIPYFIKKHYANAHITWVVDERFSDVLNYLKFVDEVVALPLKTSISKSLKVLKGLGEFDVIIDLQGLIKSAIVARMLGKNTYGFDRYSAKEGVASLFYRHKFKMDYNENIILRNLCLTAFALDFKFSKEQILSKPACFGFDKAQSAGKRVVIAPFASEENKCYDKFKEVILALSEYEIFVVFGNENELLAAKELVKNTHAKLAEKMSLTKLIDFISNSSLLIGNDSGVTHIAWAQNIPSITLFGNRPSERNAYATSINLVLDAGKKIDARNIDKNDFCIRDIKPIKIINLAKRLLNG